MNVEKILNDLKDSFSGKIVTDTTLRACFGSDSSCYEYIPKIVLFANNIKDIQNLIKLAQKHKFSITFKINGTSLSGQAQTDEVLCFVKCFNDIKIFDNANQISLGSSVIGCDANNLLKPYGKKIGPDPATINAASIGGIVANNSSGMCCGTMQNSYQCIKDIKVVLDDGFLLDTSDDISKDKFLKTHKDMVDEILALKEEIIKDNELKTLIKNKFKIKNTTGYSLNAFVDYDDVFEIIKHIMVGSEGTLGCIVETTLKSVKDYKYYASALLIYNDYKSACEVITNLATHKDIILSAEFMDYPSTKSVFGMKGVSKDIKVAKEGNGLILLKTGADKLDELEKNIRIIKDKISIKKDEAVLEKFSTIESEIASWWAARSGLLPIVAGGRDKGTAVITEDFCFKIEDLAEGITKLSDIIKKHGFDDCGSIAGHALEGNLHFILTPNLKDEKVLNSFYALLDDCVKTIVGYQGSLKAEHGTGRIIAPFIIDEWGEKAYKIKEKIKNIFDKNGIFNKDVIISKDKSIHKKNIKQRSVIDGIWDSCIECGFCEKNCPSNNAYSLSPRHRIVLKKLIQKSKDDNSFALLKEYEKGYKNYAIRDCATCHMCASLCPIGLDVGNMINEDKKSSSNKMASIFLHNKSTLINVAKVGLRLANFAPKITKFSTNVLHEVIKTPVTRDFLPNANTHEFMGVKCSFNEYILYFTTCINRGFKPSVEMFYTKNVQEAVESLCKKANINLVYPKDIKNMCCGKAYMDYEELKNENLTKIKTILDNEIKSIKTIDDKARIRILLDHGACSSYLKSCFSEYEILDSIEFAYDVLPKLKIDKKDGVFGVYTMCATKKLGLDKMMSEVVKACVENISEDTKTACCGFAGYKGFFNPKLNIGALSGFKRFYEKENIIMGFSNSSTCEIGLSDTTKVPWQSVLYLLDECSTSSLNKNKSLDSSFK